MKKGTKGSHQRNGFSIIELLCVISVMALLGTMAAPALMRVLIGQDFDRALISLGDAMEKAQAYAVANNTYTIVAFTEPDADGKVTLAVFGSRDGSPGVTDLTKTSAEYTVLEARSEAAGSLVILEKPEVLEGVKLEDTLPAGNSLALGNASSWSKNGARFVYKDRTFTRALQFTPGGEARVSVLLPEAVRLIAVPVQGKAVENAFAASAIQVSGLTGSVSIRRPGDAVSL